MKCKNCRSHFSKSAERCPHCNYKRINYVPYVLLGVVLVIALAFYVKDHFNL